MPVVRERRVAAPRTRPLLRTGIVRRPYEARVAFQDLQHLAVVPNMVAGGEAVKAHLEHLVIRLAIDAAPARQILDVTDDEIRLVAPLQVGQGGRDCPPPDPSENIREEQNNHGRKVAQKARGLQFEHHHSQELKLHVGNGFGPVGTGRIVGQSPA